MFLRFSLVTTNRQIINSLDFHLIRMSYAYARSATPQRLTSINILGPLTPRARPGAAGVFVYPGSGVRIPGHVFQLTGFRILILRLQYSISELRLHFLVSSFQHPSTHFQFNCRDSAVFDIVWIRFGMTSEA